MREQLLGYLMEALEADERQRLEEALRRDPGLQRDLELLHESLEPLRADDAWFDPPQNLASRTCERVMSQARVSPAAAVAPSESPATRSHWTVADFAVAAAIFVAASLLLFPALIQSRASARLAGCQNNLRNVGQALSQYSLYNHGYFPAIPADGNQSVAGVYAVRLSEGGYVPDGASFICPSSPLAENPDMSLVPTSAELDAAMDAELARLQQFMGGSYGYNLGYVDRGIYRSVKNRHRSTYAILADSPSLDRESRKSDNHGGCGQNVLYEDGQVRYLTQCTVSGCRDHIFLNDNGITAAGNHADDAVIGPSASRPLLRLVAEQP